VPADADGREALDQLSRVPLRIVELERAEFALISQARRRGASWGDVAQALGLATRQAAQQRFNRLGERVDADGADGSPSPTSSEEQPGTAVPSRHSRRSAHTRQRLISSTAQVLIERGYASTRLSDIAARAELQPGSVYHHFRSKDDLVEEVLRFGVIVAHRRVTSSLDELDPQARPIDRLATAMAAHLRAMVDLDAVARAHPQAFPQVPVEVKRRVRPFRRAYGALWSELVGRAIDAGELRTDVDRYLIRLFLVNTVEFAAIWAWRAHRPLPELAGTIERLIMEGAAGTNPRPG
jgi:TetR/AcrR family transcriptional regulator, cholesterol catabolism regulator